MTRELALEVFEILLDYVKSWQGDDCVCAYVDDYVQYTAMLEAKDKRWNGVLRALERQGLPLTSYDYLRKLILVYAGDDVLCVFVLRTVSDYDKDTMGIRCEYSTKTHRCYAWEKECEDEWKRCKLSSDMDAYLSVLRVLVLDIFSAKLEDLLRSYKKLKEYLKSLE